MRQSSTTLKQSNSILTTNGESGFSKQLTRKGWLAISGQPWTSRLPTKSPLNERRGNKTQALSSEAWASSSAYVSESTTDTGRSSDADCLRPEGGGRFVLRSPRAAVCRWSVAWVLRAQNPRTDSSRQGLHYKFTERDARHDLSYWVQELPLAIEWAFTAGVQQKWAQPA